MEVKNESMEKALDEALKIQEAELKQQQQSSNNHLSSSAFDEAEVNQIKPVWDCLVCTYQNYAPNVFCEMC